MPPALERHRSREKPRIKIPGAFRPHARVNPLRLVMLKRPVKCQSFFQQIGALLLVHGPESKQDFRGRQNRKWRVSCGTGTPRPVLHFKQTPWHLKIRRDNLILHLSRILAYPLNPKITL